MPTLRFTPHPAQQTILNSKARFKVAACGRRFGKSVLAIIDCIIKASTDCSPHTGKPWHSDSEVVYFGVTEAQARRNVWGLLKKYTRGVATKVHENNAVVTMPNDVKIRLMGMDNPDAARGMKLRHAVLDEYADMPDWVWMSVIRPALSDTDGGGLFIGTPKGKTHFYELALCAQNNPPVTLPDGRIAYPYADYEFFNYAQSANPTISPSEQDDLAAEYTNGSSQLYEQEIEAKFISQGGDIFSADQFVIGPEPLSGSYFVSVDLSGFAKEPGKKAIKKLDDTAITIAKVDGHKWWIKEQISGQWTTRETALRIVKAAKSVEAVALGIEKGALLNACWGYLEDYQRQFNQFYQIKELSHGNRFKPDRIQWELQGRLEKGQITFGAGEYLPKLIDQACDFPSHLSHDDCLDSLAYVGQLAPSASDFDPELLARINAINNQPLDARSGY